MRVYLMLILIVVFSSCVRNKNGNQINNAESTVTNAFEVSEVVQGGSYSYLKVKENLSERWVAVSRQEVSVGEVYYYDEALQMSNFHSKELDRTFDDIYFVNQISKTPLGQPGQGDVPAHSGKVQVDQKSAIQLKKADTEITVGQVFANRADYSGKVIEIRGVVVKVNEEVMGKNWIHIQDGTDSEGSFDLTITTQDVAEVNDEVIFKGKITIEKDFGYGYFYDVIMEEAVLVKKGSVNL